MTPSAILIHGLGAAPSVWGPVAEVLSGRGIEPLLPALPGHATQKALQRYSYGELAASVARQCKRPAGPVVVAGHSLGGVVALVLASGWFGLAPVAAVGLGIKIAWNDEELAQARLLAERPPRILDSREAAVTWAGKLAGLAAPESLLGFAEEAVGPAEGGGFRARWDPRSAMLAGPPVAAMVATATCPVVLTRGEHDHMNTDADNEAILPGSHAIPGVGHNAQVEAPEAVADLICGLF